MRFVHIAKYLRINVLCILIRVQLLQYSSVQCNWYSTLMYVRHMMHTIMYICYIVYSVLDMIIYSRP